MENDKKGDTKEPVVTPPVADTKEPSQASKKERTHLERLRVTKARLEREIADEEARSGVSPTIDEEDDDKPLTKRDLKKIQLDEAKKTALDMAKEIEDEDDRSKVIEILETRVLPSGNAQKDLQFARDVVNSEKNRQIAELAAKGKVITRGSGGGAPPKVEDRFEPTQEELVMAKMAGKSDEKSIKEFVAKVRKAEEASRKE